MRADLLSPLELERIVALRCDLHAHPELSLQEERTARVVSAFLRECGFEVTERVRGWGVVATVIRGHRLVRFHCWWTVGHDGDEDLRSRRFVSEGTMQAHRLEVAPPAFDNDLRLGDIRRSIPALSRIMLEANPVAPQAEAGSSPENEPATRVLLRAKPTVTD